MDRKNLKKEKTGMLLILIAGCFWGSMGIFVRALGEMGFDSLQIVAIRLTLAAVFFCVILCIKDPGKFRIAWKDIPLFAALGLGSVLFFAACYFKAISMMSLSVAAILLYTSPVWILLMSVAFFHEKLNRRKVLALILAFGGCVLISGISQDGVTLFGFLVGLGSGVGYGLYSILGTVALRKYSAYTVTTYTFLFAALGAVVICHPKDMLETYWSAPDRGGLFLFCVLTAIVTAVIPFLTYTLGLESVEASRAGILATIEPVVATLIGIFVFSESLSLSSGVGIVLILGAVVLLNLPPRQM